MISGFDIEGGGRGYLDICRGYLDFILVLSLIMKHA
jgi:hypothetical protein